MAKERVAVLGASPNPERYSNKAVKSLLAHGHEVVPVNPGYESLEGLEVKGDLYAVQGKVDTISLYIGPSRVGDYIEQIVEINPGRVILNPGTESEPLMRKLEEAQIPYEAACTLVLLATNQF